MGPPIMGRAKPGIRPAGRGPPGAAGRTGCCCCCCCIGANPGRTCPPGGGMPPGPGGPIGRMPGTICCCWGCCGCCWSGCCGGCWPYAGRGNAAAGPGPAGRIPGGCIGCCGAIPGGRAPGNPAAGRQVAQAVLEEARIDRIRQDSVLRGSEHTHLQEVRPLAFQACRGAWEQLAAGQPGHWRHRAPRSLHAAEWRRWAAAAVRRVVARSPLRPDRPSEHVDHAHEPILHTTGLTRTRSRSHRNTSRPEAGLLRLVASRSSHRPRTCTSTIPGRVAQPRAPHVRQAEGAARLGAPMTPAHLAAAGHRHSWAAAGGSQAQEAAPYSTTARESAH